MSLAHVAPVLFILALGIGGHDTYSPQCYRPYMARLARIVIPGLPHHVTQRGRGVPAFSDPSQPSRGHPRSLLGTGDGCKMNLVLEPALNPLVP